LGGPFCVWETHTNLIADEPLFAILEQTGRWPVVAGNRLGKKGIKETMMEIHHSTLEQDVHVLKPYGPLSGIISEEVKLTINEVYNQGARHVIVNLEEVPFIDSRGLAVLASVLKSANDDGRTLRLAGPQSQPKLVFELTGFDKVFHIFDTVAAAIVQPSFELA
jgi:anti-sigma B factor antagonist